MKAKIIRAFLLSNPLRITPMDKAEKHYTKLAMRYIMDVPAITFERPAITASVFESESLEKKNRSKISKVLKELFGESFTNLPKEENAPLE